MSDGFVYFIKMEETGEIKIGFTEKNPKERLKDLQTGNSNKLILLGYIDGTNQDEFNLHQEFSEERKSIGEWFKPSPRLEFRIKELLEESLEDKKRGIEDLNLDYFEGSYNGQGTYTWSNGDMYVGKWKNEKRNGKGTYTWSDGSKYVGEFKDNKFHGQGTHTWSEGVKYVGEWKDGFEWNGTQYNKDGNYRYKYVKGKSFY